MRTKIIDLFYRTASGTKNIRTLLTPVGMLVFALFVSMFVFVAVQVDILMKFPKFLSFPLNLILSIPMLSFGLFMIGWSMYNFFKVKGTPVPFNPPPVLVDTGPYAVTRNPMLTGVFFFLFGLGFLFSSLSLVLFFAPLFVLAMALELKAIEEPELTKRLGEQYLDYKSRTPMFFPSFKGLVNKDKAS